MVKGINKYEILACPSTIRTSTLPTLSFIVEIVETIYHSSPQTPASPSHTYQCVNGHIVCEKCRPKTLRCPLCRVQLGRGRCLVADKILTYLHNNSTIKIGLVCDSEKMSSKIDEARVQRTAENISSEDRKSTENLHAKRSAFLPFKLKLKTITFWKNA